MADEQSDPLVAVLDKSGLSNAQKRGLWDLYRAAKNPKDLVPRLDSLQIPNAVKRDLWSLKAAESGVETDELPAPKLEDMRPFAINEEGQRIDEQGKPVERGFLDKLVAVGRGENPVATLAIDLLPLASAAGTISGRSVLNRVGTSIGEASTPAKMGAAYATLKAANHVTGGMLPEPIPTLGAILTGHLSERAAARPAATAAAEAVAETTPMGFPKPEPQLTPREFTAIRKQQWQTITGQKKLPAPEGSVAPKVAPEAVEPEMKAVLKPAETVKAVEAAADVPKLTVKEAQAAVKQATKETADSAEYLYRLIISKANLGESDMAELMGQFRKMPLKQKFEAIYSAKSVCKPSGSIKELLCR